MTGGEAPIGFWLKHLDGLLERQPAAELADHGLLRRHWQVLNTLSRSPARRGQLAEALAPFWNDSEGPSLDEVLAALADRGWTASGGAEAPDEEDGTLALTGAGRAAHADIAERIAAARAAAADGLTPEQYAEAVRVLSVMAANVERALGDR
ncbi:MarR family winged helix-turn-helix transcriptional regulator [Streptomonospora nanhaiensis]|uniref:DNA-binding MarR family transcriptional regulator n=1 Tax=Streptomonospora nanhaiensis TaxID=1323731 RepID=A0A853BW11_9ACTN|nr:MarR family transcriptional regulator [Streptomonospora nanhaiensis]MBX9387135.1 MarR family transcriptional regulator [Streptomonospora nanhaiensis]NYI98925.1 DNA-binding MarR family transcriptional regulator [Streptomonospora nanhaiensis]